MKESEQWKPVIGYEGLYEISNHGRVKSLERKDSIGRRVKEKILILSLDTNKYKVVSLSKNGKIRTKRVNRLVAIHFVPNSKDLPEVNHLDGDKINNYYKNLEWCTHSKNVQHAWKTGLCNTNHCSKRVYCSELGQEFSSIRKAARQLNIDNSAISKCCRGILDFAGRCPNDKKIKLTWFFLDK